MPEISFSPIIKRVNLTKNDPFSEILVSTAIKNTLQKHHFLTNIFESGAYNPRKLFLPKTDLHIQVSFW